MQKLQMHQGTWGKQSLWGSWGNGVKKGEEDSFTVNSETSGNWTGWHYVWMRLVFLFMAGKSFRGMLELFGRIPLAWGSPPLLMMNRAGSAAFSLWRFNLADSRTVSLIASAELQKEAWLKFGLRSPLAHFWQRDTSQKLHNQMYLLLSLLLLWLYHSIYENEARVIVTIKIYHTV